LASTWIDHVVLGVRNLEVAGRRLEEQFGLGSVAGGTHAGWGTGNRIVPLGRDYMELLAVADQDQADASPIGRAVGERVAAGDRWLCWCVATDDLDGTAARLDLAVDAGSRLRPEGTTLRWRSAGFSFAVEHGSLPFFITWEVSAELHPGRSVAMHRTEPSGISFVEVGADPLLPEWLGDQDLPLRIVDGAEGLLAVGIATPEGDVTVR